jgi:hypothetical protein
MNSPQRSAVRFGATWRDIGKILDIPQTTVHLCFERGKNNSA